MTPLDDIVAMVQGAFPQVRHVQILQSQAIPGVIWVATICNDEDIAIDSLAAEVLNSDPKRPMGTAYLGARTVYGALQATVEQALQITNRPVTTRNRFADSDQAWVRRMAGVRMKAEVISAIKTVEGSTDRAAWICNAPSPDKAGLCTQPAGHRGRHSAKLKHTADTDMTSYLRAGRSRRSPRKGDVITWHGACNAPHPTNPDIRCRLVGDHQEKNHAWGGVKWESD